MKAEDWYALKWSWEKKEEVPDWIEDVKERGEEKTLTYLVEEYERAKEILSLYINHRFDSLPENES